MSDQNNNTQVTKPSFGQYLKAVGPAIVISAVVVGPGSVTTASSMGAQYRYTLLWAVVLAAVCAFFYQLPALQVGINKQTTVMEAVRQRFGKPMALVLFALLTTSAIIFQAGNFSGAALAMQFFFPNVSILVWDVIMILAAFILVWIGKYNILENFTKFLVIVMVGSFVITAFGSGASMGEVVSEGFSFKVPGGDFYLVLAMLATTMVPDIPVSLSALHKERYFRPGSFEASLPTNTKMKMARFDLAFGQIVTLLITAAIIVCAATTIYPGTVSSGADMAKQLTPVLGRYAGVLFAFGLWGAAFSSGLFRIELLPLLFNQAIGKDEDMKAGRSRIWMILGAGIPLIFC
ncbi:MAG: Nramp family divalent metal transporter, partial [Firmicutes bacterium]|nr:Nramp family divalent metal transporter [Bacillota bacterium]